MPPYWRATFASSTISSVDANRPGTYCSEVLTPSAPSRIAWSTSFFIASISSAVAARSVMPIT